THSLYCLINEGTRSPIGGAATDIEDKVRQNLRAARRMLDFGMKLDSVHAARDIAHRCDGRISRLSKKHKARRWLLNAISVTHPHVEIGGEVLPEGNLAQSCDLGRAVFAMIRWGDFAT